MRELVVMTQNVFGGGAGWSWRRRAIARKIAASGADVVGLQEVHADDPRSPETQAHELARLAGGYHVDFAPGRVAPSGACEGVALLCKREIRERAVLALTLDRRDMLDRAGQRVVLAATLDLDARPVDVFVTHLSLSRRARARTIQELVDFAALARARSGSAGAVLMGDLNARPTEEAMRALAKGWTDATRGDARGATWPYPFPYARLDYVLIQPESRWIVRAGARVRSVGSDHLGIVARVALA